MDLQEEMRTMMDLVQRMEIEQSINDADPSKLEEAPVLDDVYAGDRTASDASLEVPSFDPKSKNLRLVRELPDYNIYKNPRGDAYMAITKDGEKVLGTVQGELTGGTIFKVGLSNAHSSTKGVMYNIYTSIIKDHKKVLSDTIQSPSAKAFWSRLISSPNHVVYIVIDGEVVQKAVPEKLEKYWSTDPKHISSSIQFLLTQ